LLTQPRRSREIPPPNALHLGNYTPSAIARNITNAAARSTAQNLGQYEFRGPHHQQQQWRPLPRSRPPPRAAREGRKGANETTTKRRSSERMTREGGARIREEGRGAIWQKNDSRLSACPSLFQSAARDVHVLQLAGFCRGAPIIGDPPRALALSNRAIEGWGPRRQVGCGLCPAVLTGAAA
jgi:hypothetical protein